MRSELPWLATGIYHMVVVVGLGCVPVGGWLFAPPELATTSRAGSPLIIRVSMAEPPPLSETVDVSLDSVPVAPPDLAPLPATMNRIQTDNPLAPPAVQAAVVADQPRPAPAPVERAAPPREPTTPPIARQALRKTPRAEIEVETPYEVARIVGGHPDKLPSKLPNNLEPLYPVDALQAGAEGRVLLRAKIAATGHVSEVAIQRSSGHASLDRAALAAVREWRFAPAERRGVRLEYEVVVPVRFIIR
jgi:protein TonB